MLDGTIAAASANVLIYATSNRRHLLPEYFSENLETRHVGEEVHPGESVEEKISLSERFGLWISFYPFSQDDYLAAVDRLARGTTMCRCRATGRGSSRRCTATRSSSLSAVGAAGASPGKARPRDRGGRITSFEARGAAIAGRDARKQSARSARVSVRRPTSAVSWRVAAGRPGSRRCGSAVLAQRLPGTPYPGYRISGRKPSR